MSTQSNLTILAALGVCAASLAAWLARPASSEVTTTGDPSSVAACEAQEQRASEYGTLSGLVRAETDALDVVADWQERRHAPDIRITSPLRVIGTTATAPVVVCVFAGEFVTPAGPPGPNGERPKPHNRITLLVLPDGSLILDSAGHADWLGEDTPQQWLARVG